MDDPRAFADTLVWFRDHRNEAREMGRRGRALAESEFNRERLAAQFVGVLEAAFRARSAPRRPSC